jgi:hypothetical protein
MIIFPSIFLILLMILTVSWFIIPFCIFVTELYKDITGSLRWGKRFPFVETFEFALGVLVAFWFSAFATFGLGSDLYSLWNPEKQSGEPVKSRNVHIQVPEKVQIHTEFRLDNTVIGKEVL